MAPGAIALPLYPNGNKNTNESVESGEQLNDERLTAAELEYEAAGDNAEGAHLLSSSSGSLENNGNPRVRRRRQQSSRSDNTTTTVSRSTLTFAGGFIAVTALIFLIIPAFIPETTHHYTGMTPQHDVRYSNGTHQFRKTVLMVSIDGLR